MSDTTFPVDSFLTALGTFCRSRSCFTWNILSCSTCIILLGPCTSREYFKYQCLCLFLRLFVLTLATLSVSRVLNDSLTISTELCRAMAQALSRWLTTAADRVRAQIRPCRICDEQSGTGESFLRVLRLPLPIHRLLHNRLSRPNSDRSSKWTQAQPTHESYGLGRTWKAATEARFEIPSLHLTGLTENNHEKSLRIVGGQHKFKAIASRMPVGGVIS
jgi:hypothetical protein